MSTVKNSKRKDYHWNSKDERILRKSLKGGLTLNQTAEILGRTPSAVSFHKSSLGLKGRFVHPKKVAKTTKQENSPNLFTQLQEKPSNNFFEIETGVPIPGKLTKYAKERGYIRNTLDRMEVKQSFVIPRQLLNPTRLIANSEFGHLKIKATATSPEKKFYRIFRLA